MKKMMKMMKKMKIARKKLNKCTFQIQRNLLRFGVAEQTEPEQQQKPKTKTQKDL